MLQWESKDAVKWEDKAQVWWGLDFWWLRWYKICPQCGRSGFDPWVRKIPWRSERQPTSVFLPGKSHVQRSLVGYSPWSLKELDTTERLSLLVGLRLHRCVLWTFGAPKRWAGLELLLLLPRRCPWVCEIWWKHKGFDGGSLGDLVVFWTSAISLFSACQHLSFITVVTHPESFGSSWYNPLGEGFLTAETFPLVCSFLFLSSFQNLIVFFSFCFVCLKSFSPVMICGILSHSGD